MQNKPMTLKNMEPDPADGYVMPVFSRQQRTEMPISRVLALE